jgi:hypothetical protein
MDDTPLYECTLLLTSNHVPTASLYWEWEERPIEDISELHMHDSEYVFGIRIPSIREQINALRCIALHCIALHCIDSTRLKQSRPFYAATKSVPQRHIVLMLLHASARE